MPLKFASKCLFVLLLFMGGMGHYGFTQTSSKEEIPPVGRWVTDQADLLSPVEERALAEKLKRIADTTSIQIVIVTVPSLEGRDIAEYAVAIGEKWGVGQEKYDNGIVILVARKERRVFIATGLGVEGVLPDVLVGRIVREIIVPHFKRGEYYQGLSRAVDALVSIASGEFDEAVQTPNRKVSKEEWVLWFVLFIILAFVLEAIVASRRSRKWRRKYVQQYGADVFEGMEIPAMIIWGTHFPHGHIPPHHRPHEEYDTPDFGWDDIFSGGGGSFGGGGAGGSW